MRSISWISSFLWVENKGVSLSSIGLTKDLYAYSKTYFFLVRTLEIPGEPYMLGAFRQVL